MAKYRKKSVIIEATQWFKNGDHPKDHVGKPQPSEGESELVYCEGKVVRYYRHPEVDDQQQCEKCGDIMHNHGWIDTLPGGHIVCPGDWIVTGINGGFYPRKPHTFEMMYEPVPE